jgi:hypothetical protein
MDQQLVRELPAILAIVFSIGGGILFAIVRSVSTNWRIARVAEQNAVLKRAMLDKGFTPEEIARVIESGSDPEAKMAESRGS